jgi:hypothetical protein
MRRFIVIGLVLQTFIYSEAVREIPPELYSEYTLNGKIPVLYSYFDDSYPPTEPLFYSRSAIEERIEKIHRREVGHYGQTDLWLYEALEIYPIRGKEVVIIGSASPWYESVVIAFGGKPTTIEYNKIITDDPRLTVLTVEEFKNTPKKFDVVLCISSIEHDGLGRYGDPLDPSADLKFMQMVKNDFLKPNGRMILAVPIGQDVLTWNRDRVYGSIRFPMLIKGWKIVKHFGFNPAEFQGAFGNYAYQPIFYLAPKKDVIR